MCGFAVIIAFAVGIGQNSAAQQRGEGAGGQGGGPAAGRRTYSLSDPVPNDPALKSAMDMHAHQDPDSNGPSYGQARDPTMRWINPAKILGLAPPAGTQ